MSGSELPLALMGRLIKRAGADRVSEGARVVLSEVLEDLVVGVSSRAVAIASLDGRKTVREEDVRKALEEVWV